MSDLAYTPTRQMAQSGAMKASDAYALARQSMARVEALEQTVEAQAAELVALNTRLRATLDGIERQRKPRQKAA